MFSLNVRSQSVPKDFVSVNHNEDRFLVAENFIALADGAGGTGILCGEWAEFLLSKLPDEPISCFEDFKFWLEQHVDDFLEEYEPKISHDSYKMRRFYEEGSASTLAVVWQKGNKYHWLTYGDSHVFIVNKTNVKTYPYKKAEDFERGTHLLNWTNQPTELGFKQGSFSKTSCIILATDAISKHIFEKYIDQNTSKKWLPIEDLFRHLETKQSFIDCIKAETSIAEDDYSMIIAKPSL
jgi:hypothetical protein